MRKILCFFLLLAASLCTFTACSSDDGDIFYDTSGNTFSSTQLVGTWNNDYWGTVTLNSMGAATFYRCGSTLSWSLSGDKLTFTRIVGPITIDYIYYIVSVSDDEVVVQEEDHYSTKTFYREK